MVATAYPMTHAVETPVKPISLPIQPPINNVALSVQTSRQAIAAKCLGAVFTSRSVDAMQQDVSYHVAT